MFEHPDPLLPKEKTETLPRGSSSVLGRGPGAPVFGKVSCEQDPDAQWEQGWGRRAIDAIRYMDISFEEHFSQTFLFGRLLRNLSLCARHCDRPSADTMLGRGSPPPFYSKAQA